MTCLATGVVAALLPSKAATLGQPMQIRRKFENGREWMVLIPVVFIVSWMAWSLGPVIEKALFIYKDQNTGREIADFRLWWPQATGLSYDQKNSLVVGFAMGFAVIPVIFTIAELLILIR